MLHKEAHFTNDFVAKSGAMWRILCNFEAEILIQYVHTRFLGHCEAKMDAKGSAKEDYAHVNDFVGTRQNLMCEK